MPADVIPWEELKLEYNTDQRYMTYKFRIPPEARDRLPLPGGYYNAPMYISYLPIPGKERKIYIIHRVEGHRSESLSLCICL